MPYRNAFVKYTPTWPRSFTPQHQSMRNLVAKMKLIPNTELLRGKEIAFCDDSIVRGTQLRDNVRHLYDYGTGTIHGRISCPPILFPCEFINFSPSHSMMELIARRAILHLEGDANANVGKYVRNDTPEHANMVEYIRKELNLGTLKFCTVEDVVNAIGLPKESICTYCFDGVK